MTNETTGRYAPTAIAEIAEQVLSELGTLYPRQDLDLKAVAALAAHALRQDAAQRPAAQPATQDSREAFEAWAKQEGFSTKRIDSPDGVYANSGTHVAWSGWQAALTSRPVPPPVSDELIEQGFRTYDWSSVPHPFRGSVGFERGVRWAESQWKGGV